MTIYELCFLASLLTTVACGVWIAIRANRQDNRSMIAAANAEAIREFEKELQDETDAMEIRLAMKKFRGAIR